MMRRVHTDQRGSTIVTALMAAAVMLVLGMALLAIVDSQANQSGEERTRDRAFNLAESVLTSQAFVLGRSWPNTAPASNPVCSAAGAGFADMLGSTATAVAAVERLRPNLNASYTETEYTGATWQVNLCDDIGGAEVWTDDVLLQKTWDANGNNLIWVRAQAIVRGKASILVSLVKVRETPMFDSKFAVVAGRMTDDLGTTVNNLSTNALGGVLSGLLGTTPTVVADPTKPATTPPSSGVTGLRCGALDVTVVPVVTCLAGTLGAASAIPLISTLITGGKLEQFPRTTTAANDGIDALRSQAVGTNTYYATSPGASTSAAAPACSLAGNTGTPSVNTVVFIEKVGGGDDWCVIDVSAGRQYKALVIGSGRVVFRGNNTTTAAPSGTVTGPQINTFSGVIYALNNQRLTAAEGGLGLGDATTPGREVIRVELGAHVKGAVYADGKSGRVGIYPPALTLNTNALVDALIPCTVILGITNCTLRNTIKALGLTALVDQLISIVGLNTVVNAILGQLNTQRSAYGSAVTADVNAINALTVYGSSGTLDGTFRNLRPE